MANSYHNTNRLNQKETDLRTEKAKNQDEKVLEAATSIGRKCIPDDILKKLIETDFERFRTVPITSIRRSVQTLIRKCKMSYAFDEYGLTQKVIGPLGHPVGLVRVIGAKPKALDFVTGGSQD
jgi:hypothetical protein